MIITELKDAKSFYDLHERMKKALQYIENTDLQNIENGKYFIDDDNIYAIVQDYQTKPQVEGKWEAHKKYIDIQYIIKGKEKIGWGLISNFSAITDYDADKDIFFLQGKGEFLIVKEGSFTILKPEDVHMPSISVNKKPEYVKKVVIKVRDWR